MLLPLGMSAFQQDLDTLKADFTPVILEGLVFTWLAFGVGILGTRRRYFHHSYRDNMVRVNPGVIQT